MTAVNEIEEQTEGFVQTHPYVTPAQAQRLRVVAFMQEKSRSEIVREALDEWFDKHAQ